MSKDRGGGGTEMGRRRRKGGGGRRATREVCQVSGFGGASVLSTPLDLG